MISAEHLVVTVSVYGCSGYLQLVDDLGFVNYSTAAVTSFDQSNTHHPMREMLAAVERVPSSTHARHAKSSLINENRVRMIGIGGFLVQHIETVSPCSLLSSRLGHATQRIHLNTPLFDEYTLGLQSPRQALIHRQKQEQIHSERRCYQHLPKRREQADKTDHEAMARIRKICGHRCSTALPMGSGSQRRT